MKTIKLLLILALFPLVAGADVISGGQVWPEFEHINADTVEVWSVLDLLTHSPSIWGGTFTSIVSMAADSVFVVNSIVGDSAYIDVDSTDTNHLVVNTTAALGAAVTSDSGGTVDFKTNLFLIGALTTGDQDIILRFGGDTNNDITWDYGDSLFVIDGGISTSGNIELKLASVINARGIMNFQNTNSYINPKVSAIGVLYVGGDEADTVRVRSNDVFNVQGIATFDGATQVDALSFDSFFATYVSYDSTATVSASAYVVLLDTAAGQDTLNLAAASGQTGRTINIKSINANGAHIDAYGAETIDGSAVIDASQWDNYTLFCNGTAWFIL